MTFLNEVDVFLAQTKPVVTGWDGELVVEALEVLEVSCKGGVEEVSCEKGVEEVSCEGG